MPAHRFLTTDESDKMSTPFNILIAQINQGADNSNLSADMDELLRTVQATGRAGSLTITIKIVPATADRQSVDKLTVQIDRGLKLPKPESAKDFFFITEDGELTRKHPKQQELELRDVTLQGGIAGSLKTINA